MAMTPQLAAACVLLAQSLLFGMYLSFAFRAKSLMLPKEKFKVMMQYIHAALTAYVRAGNAGWEGVQSRTRDATQ